MSVKTEFNRAQEVLFKLPLAVLAEDEHRKISNHTQPTDFFKNAEPFRQLNRDTQEQQGSGLGVYLCKELAKRNNWDLSHTYQNDQSTILLRITT